MNWSYVAGFFDGEGTVSLHGTGKVSINPDLTFHQSSRFVLDEIYRFMASEGVESVVRPVKPKKARTWHKKWRVFIKTKKIQYVLYVMKRENVAVCLRKMMPFLVVKKSAAEDVLRLLKLFPVYLAFRTNFRREYASRNQVIGRVQAEEIRRIYRPRVKERSLKVLAKKYKVHLGTIWNIVHAPEEAIRCRR